MVVAPAPVKEDAALAAGHLILHPQVAFFLLKCVSFGGIGYLLLVRCTYRNVTPVLVSYLFSFLDSVVLARHMVGTVLAWAKNRWL